MVSVMSSEQKRRTFFWLLMLPIYWYIVFYLLWHASPIGFDGSGPDASFYWGRHTIEMRL